MKPWALYAVISMFFAGLTSVIAKLGLSGISGDLGLAIRTGFVFVFVLIFAAAVLQADQWAQVTRTNVLWLAASALTTSLSWIFYYKALAQGDVSKVALIDKGSVAVAILLSALILKEQLTWRTLLGGALVVSGLLVIAKK